MVRETKLSLTLDEALAHLTTSEAGAPSTSTSSTATKGNCLPISARLPADTLTPVIAYLRLTNGARSGESFLMESVVRGETGGRWSYVGANPKKVLRTGANFELQGDPLKHLEKDLADYSFINVPGAPPLTGGMFGYVSYDCIHYFEPKTARELSDPLGIPESVFLLADTLIAFDHLFQHVYIVSHVYVPPSTPSEQVENTIKTSYAKAKNQIEGIVALVFATDSPLPMPAQPKITIPAKEAVSNVGKAGYEGFVTSLKTNIVQGDIIQAVPSQRLRRETDLHPFNVYRHLRGLNPSPYMFYVDCGNELCLVGASPECLCKVEKNVVTNHAIAGTVRRGKSAEEDEILAAELQGSLKDRAEHVMLVDLARNDVNRVCRPETVKVDSLMQVEKFSHVMHLTSQVSGKLRDGLTRYVASFCSGVFIEAHSLMSSSARPSSRFDAFRSIFPAGTVSGAPKIRAIQLVGELEQERRGVYAGAIGHFDFASDSMDTCIAIRTMTFFKGVAYLQAGGGIVFDSVEEDEYVETINKLASNVKCLSEAEAYHASLQEE